MSTELSTSLENLQVGMSPSVQGKTCPRLKVLADDRPCLPLDVIGEIAKFLIDDYAFGTCASLNVTAKAIEEETAPILWKICVLPGAQAFRRLSPSARGRSSNLSAAKVRSLEDQKAWYDGNRSETRRMQSGFSKQVHISGRA